MYGRTREAKNLEEAIFLTTPAPEMRMIMKEMEEETEEDSRGREHCRTL